MGVSPLATFLASVDSTEALDVFDAPEPRRFGTASAPGAAGDGMGAGSAVLVPVLVPGVLGH